MKSKRLILTPTGPIPEHRAWVPPELCNLNHPGDLFKSMADKVETKPTLQSRLKSILSTPIPFWLAFLAAAVSGVLVGMVGR